MHSAGVVELTIPESSRNFWSSKVDVLFLSTQELSRIVKLNNTSSSLFLHHSHFCFRSDRSPPTKENIEFIFL